MRTIATCPGCGGTDREPVCEFNGLVLLDAMRASPLTRYAYALCRTCGLVFATRRPEGDELAFLYERFDEVLGRSADEQTGGRVGPVGDAERREILAQLARGWLLTEEAHAALDPWVEEVFEERVLNSFHVNVVGSLVPVEGKRILELRATTGFMLDVLRRRYGAAEVFAMPMSDRHAIVIDALNPMPMALIDFDRLEVPFDGTFDLILARHMVTHAVEPARLWNLLHTRLAPGGYVYFFLENDDRAMLQDKRKNLLGEMKCFHFQNFDLPAFARVLRYNGLDPVFIRHPRPGRSEMMCVARKNARVTAEPIAPGELDARLALYRRWRDHSVLSLGDDIQALFGREVEAMRLRAVADGYAAPDKSGRIVPKKPLRLMHEAGYARLNEQRSTELR